MIRAALDTNTIVSGLGWGGPPGAVLDAALAGHFEIVTSPALLEELHRVLAYPKLQAVIGDSDQLIELLALAAPTTRGSRTQPCSASRRVDGLDPWTRPRLDSQLWAVVSGAIRITVRCSGPAADGRESGTP